MTSGVGLGELCSILAVLCYAPMLVKATFMLQPQAYNAHTMLMNIIDSLPLGIHSSDLMVITKWLCV